MSDCDFKILLLSVKNSPADMKRTPRSLECIHAAQIGRAVVQSSHTCQQEWHGCLPEVELHPLCMALRPVMHPIQIMGSHRQILTSRYDADPQKLRVLVCGPDKTCCGAKLLYMPAIMV